MKVAYICPDLGIPVLGSKGASVHVREFTAALADLGHEVRIYAAAGRPRDGAASDTQTTCAPFTVLPASDATRSTAAALATAMIRLGWQRERAELVSELQHLVADPAFVERAIPLVRAFQPDVVIARHALFSLAGVEVARAARCACVLEVNAPLLEERRRYWHLSLDRLAEHADRTAFSQADALIAVSEGVRTYLVQLGAPAERIAVVPNGADLVRFQPAVSGAAVRQRYHLDDAVVLGFVGSLKLWHGVDLLMRAFASVRAAQATQAAGDSAADAVRLLIVGDGPQRQALAHLAVECGVSDAVTFTGAVAHDAVPEYIAAMDVTIAPYRSTNGFYFSPLKVMEYLAMGKPIVAPLLGQVPSLLQEHQGSCGLLYAPDDLHGLAAALLALVRDPAQRELLGARARAHALRGSSWRLVAQRILARVPERAMTPDDGVDTPQDEPGRGTAHPQERAHAPSSQVF